jgi:hypothetical protein
MKTKKAIFQVFSGLGLLLVLSIHSSCDLMGCYTCTRTNSTSGKTDKTSTCSSDEADKLRSQGWTCKGGW